MNFVNHVKTHAFIFLIGKLNSVQVSGQSGKGKTFPSCYQPEEIKKAQILASLTCQIWRVPIALVTDPGYWILLAFETGEYWTAPLCTWQLPLSPRTWNHALAFLKENTSFFCFFLPFTLVLQLYLPPLAEICLCLGQTVFPSLSLLYAAALLLDPQWQWRGTLVFNLFSHSQILCCQVINLCSPFTACCMLCACPVHALRKLVENTDF